MLEPANGASRVGHVKKHRQKPGAALINRKENKAKDVTNVDAVIGEKKETGSNDPVSLVGSYLEMSSTALTAAAPASAV